MIAANPGANSVLGINLWFMWLFRSHNAAARELARHNPCWDDERLFHTARAVTIARYQHVLYYELWSELLGERTTLHYLTDYLLHYYLLVFVCIVPHMDSRSEVHGPTNLFCRN